MKTLFIPVLGSILALLFACTYSESDIFHVDPVPGDPPEIWVTTNLDTVDDPTVSDSLEIVYDVDIVNGKFYQIEAYVMNSMVFNSDTTHGSFWITPSFVIEPGMDTLAMYFFFSTNSNSLADIVDLEFNFITLKYPIYYEEGGAK